MAKRYKLVKSCSYWSFSPQRSHDEFERQKSPFALEKSVEVDLNVSNKFGLFPPASTTDLHKSCVWCFQVRKRHLDVIHEQVELYGRQVRQSDEGAWIKDDPQFLDFKKSSLRD